MAGPGQQHKGRSFSEPENALLREKCEALTKRYGTRSKLAEALGIHQSPLSAFLNGRTDAGPKLARAIASEYGQTMDELLGLRPRAPSDPKYPNRGLAIEAARRIGAPPEAVAALEKVDPPQNHDRPAWWWMGKLVRLAQDLD